MATLEGVNASLASAVQRLIAEAPFRIGIASGFRTRDQQQALYNRYKAGKGALAAAPGRSNHEHGNAVDLDYPDDPAQRRAAAQWVRQNAARFGVHLPVRGEDWHVELVDGGAHPGAGLDDEDARLNTGNPEDALFARLDAIRKAIRGETDTTAVEAPTPQMRTETTTVPATPTRGTPFPLSGARQQKAGEVLANAKTIAQVGRQMGMPDAAIKIALAAALVESNLRNVNHGDRDSLGLFQQRPSQGWGTPQQVMDPTYAATQFYTRLRRLDWQRMDPGRAAQAVQRSAYPDRYGKRMGEAASIFNQLGRI